MSVNSKQELLPADSCKACAETNLAAQAEADTLRNLLNDQIEISRKRGESMNVAMLDLNSLYAEACRQRNALEAERDALLGKLDIAQATLAAAEQKHKAVVESIYQHESMYRRERDELQQKLDALTGASAAPTAAPGG